MSIENKKVIIGLLRQFSKHNVLFLMKKILKPSIFKKLKIAELALDDGASLLDACLGVEIKPRLVFVWLVNR